MSTRELTCIICPMGCRMKAQIEGENIEISGNSCKRGLTYAVQEISCPMRTVTSLIAIDGDDLPLCPVKTAGQVPKSKIGEVLSEIRSASIKAPVRVGEVLLSNVAQTGVNIVATANR